MAQNKTQGVGQCFDFKKEVEDVGELKIVPEPVNLCHYHQTYWYIHQIVIYLLLVDS